MDMSLTRNYFPAKVVDACVESNMVVLSGLKFCRFIISNIWIWIKFQPKKIYPDFLLRFILFPRNNYVVCNYTCILPVLSSWLQQGLHRKHQRDFDLGLLNVQLLSICYSNSPFSTTRKSVRVNKQDVQLLSICYSNSPSSTTRKSVHIVFKN